MRESYFFRNVNNYQELLKKTKKAQERLSKNKRKVVVLCRINLSHDDFTKITSNLKAKCDIVIKYNKLMKIKNGVWNCIEIYSDEMGIIVMSDGYPYPRFVATKEYDNKQ